MDAIMSDGANLERPSRAVLDFQISRFVRVAGRCNEATARPARMASLTLPCAIRLDEDD